MKLFHRLMAWQDRPGRPEKNHTNEVPKINGWSGPGRLEPGADSKTLGVRPFVPTHEYAPGHNGIKKP